MQANVGGKFVGLMGKGLSWSVHDIELLGADILDCCVWCQIYRQFVWTESFFHLRTQLLRLVPDLKSPRKLDPASTKALVGKVGSLHCSERKAIGTLAEGSTANAETEQQPPASKTPIDVMLYSSLRS